MTTVARLLPRHWDGRRLLQFLTGLALIALAFALPALLSPSGGPAETPATVITTVDTPLPPGLPVAVAPDLAPASVPAPAAGHGPAGLALSAESPTTAQNAATATSAAGAGNVTVGGAASPGTDHAAGSPVRDAVQGVAGLPAQAPRSRHGICVEARAAVDGVTQGAHGERGPPRA